MIPGFRRRRRERELDEEIRSHFEMAVRERVARGESREEAKRAVRREFGDVGRVKEVTRSMWGGMWMDRLFQDVRFGVRSLFRAPVFTAAVVLTLALGVGLNAAVFSGVHALLLRPLSGVEDSHRLVQVYRTWPGIEHGASSIPHFRDLRDRGRDAFDGVAAWAFVTLNLSWQGQNEIVLGEMASANLFDVLGVEAALGRTFLPEEAEGVGAHPVVVLSHSAWQGRFGADPDIVGRSIRINAMPFEVVGVAPEGFKGPLDLVSPTLWAPLVMHPWLEPGSGDRSGARSSNFLRVIARLKPGMSLEAAREDVESTQAWLQASYPNEYEGSGILLVPQADAGIDPSLGSSQRGLSAVLLIVVGLLLMVACVNVANLSLVRAEDRRNEMRIRLSMGAGRGRIVRQVLTESLLLSTLSGAVGLAVAYGAVRALDRARLPLDVPVDVGFQVSGPVLLLTLVTALGTGILFGLAPALRASRSGTLNAPDGGAGGATLAGTRFSRGLVGVQTALSMVLLLGAAVFLDSLRSAADIDVGFRTDSLLMVSMNPGLLGYDRRAAETFYRELAERIEARPGVVSAAWADIVPLGLSNQQSAIGVAAYHSRSDEPMYTDYAVVGPGYFETLGVAIRGRGFTAADDSTARGALVVNEAMAARLWPGTEAIGRIVETRGRERVVVGVAQNGKYRTLGEAARPFMFVPLAQDFRSSATLLVRTSVDPTLLEPTLHRAVRELDPDMAVSPRTIRSHLGLSRLPARTAAAGLGLFGALGLLLSAVGIYGVIAYVVSRQRREIGIRMALGARRTQVLGMVVARGMRLTFVGLASGLVIAVGAAGAVRNLVYTGSTVRPLVFLGVPVIFTVVALVATWIPARRAAGVDPIRALKGE